MSSLLTLVSASGLLDPAMKSVAILLLAMVVVALFARASAAWRHFVWCVSVASLLLLPVLSLVLPDWRVDWLPQWTTKATQVGRTEQAKRAPVDHADVADDMAIASPTSAATSQTQPDNEPLKLPRATIKTTTAPRISMPWLAVAWAAGGLLALVPLATGLWQLASLGRRSRVIGDRRWLTLLDESRRQMAVRRRVQLRQCESALAPLTWGALRPVLLLPFESGTWPDPRRKLVLLHELAHVRRWDWLTQLVAHVACAAYWFNPLVWLAARQMRIERERACDDLVLSSGTRASDYARELLALAARLSDSQVTTLMAVPMARRRGLDDRIRGILDVRRSRAGLTRPAICLCALLAVAAMAPLAMLKAAPPESTEVEAPEPKNDPPAKPAIAVGAVGRQAERQAGDVQAPPAIGNAEVREIWDLSLEESIQSALTNSKVLRNLGGVLFTPTGPQSTVNQTDEGSPRDPKAGTKLRFVLARTNGDIEPADFEAGVQNLASDVERAYWDLYYNYRSLNAVQAGRDSALQTWRKVHGLFIAGADGGDAKKEAQAREQYFLFRAQVENTLGLLYTAESRLRYMMGVAPTDGRLIRPTDDPITAEIRFDWKETLSEGLGRSVELRRQRSAVKQAEDKLADARLAMSGVPDAESMVTQSKAQLQDQEMELTHVLTNGIRDLDRNYQVSRTTFNRRVTATGQVEAVKAAYDVGTATLDMLLDAHRRLSDAEIAFYRALVDYNVAILQVHFRKGSLLEHNGILVARATLEEAAPIDPFRQRVRDGD